MFLINPKLITGRHTEDNDTDTDDDDDNGPA
jgi:hypothetical protein